MALEDIIRKITEQAEEEAKRIKEEGLQASQKISQQSKIQAQTQTEQLLFDAEEESKRISRRISQQTELAGRKQLLAAKQEAVEAVFSLVEKKLFAMDDQTYLSFLEKLILDLKESGEFVVHTCAKTVKLMDQAFLAQLNQKLKTKKAGFSLKEVKEGPEISKGFTLRQQKLDLNFSFSALLKEAKKDYFQDAVSLLFPSK